jgi:hypothetical protein
VSTADKPDPARAWKYVDDLLADEELERLEKMSPEEVDGELRAVGVDPASIPSAEELFAKAEKRAREAGSAAARGGNGTGAATGSAASAKVLPLRRREGIAQYVTLAAAAAVLLFVATRPEDDGPVSAANPEAIRARAFEACAAKQWDACEEALDEAERIDRQGEDDARVREAREAIAQARESRADGG